MRIDSDDDGTDQTESHLNFLSDESNEYGTSAMSCLSEREQLYRKEALNYLDALECFASRTGHFFAAP